MENLVIVDGGTGEWIKMHDPTVVNDPYWSSGTLLKKPSNNKIIHEKFGHAGAKILFANTYSLYIDDAKSNRDLISRSLKQAAQILEVICTQYECTYRISLGPLAVKFRDCSEYTGVYIKNGDCTMQDVFEHYDSLLRELDGLSLTNIAFETIPTLIEVKAITKVLPAYHKMQAFVSVVPKNETETVGGDCLIATAKLVATCPQIIVFGINCCEPDLCLPIVKLIAPHLRDNQHIILKPNNTARIIKPIASSADVEESKGKKEKEGEKEKEKDQVEKKKEFPDNYLCQFFEEFAANKVKYIGGCCGVMPHQIRIYAEYLQAELEKKK